MKKDQLHRLIEKELRAAGLDPDGPPYSTDGGSNQWPIARELLDRLTDKVFDGYSTQHGKKEKLRIYINRKLDISPNKRAAHAVHAALEAFGVHPGVKVIVLDKGPTEIEKMRVAIHDAGHTELEPGTLTAGTNWPGDSEE